MCVYVRMYMAIVSYRLSLKSPKTFSLAHDFIKNFYPERRNNWLPSNTIINSKWNRNCNLLSFF